jgi:hypothetical protein
MNIVNELLQNIRFLKYYGWGKIYIIHLYLLVDLNPENHWGRNTNQLRETELRWRVKQNIVDTFITFIWYANAVKVALV